jgi:Tol biopolymer transport system component
MSAILNEDLPADPQFSNNAPSALQRIVRRCVEKNPEQRFQSALDAAFALDALSNSGTSTSAVATQTRSRRIWPWAVTALLLVGVAYLLATSGVAWYFHRGSATRAVTNSPPLEVHPLTESGHVFRAAASPDGRYVAYVNRGHGQDELRLLQVATRRDVQILPGSPLRIQNLHFTPDGNFIYFLQELKHENPQALGVFRIATLGGPAAPIATDAQMFGVTVSPDGKQIAYITQTATESLIVSVDPDGGNRRVLATRPLLRGFWSVEWSPSPDRLAATVAMEDYGLVPASVELPAGSIKQMSPGDYAVVGRPAWSPDGRTIFAPAISKGGGFYQIWAFDAHTGSSRPLTTSSTDYLQWSLSATSAGDLVANTITRDTTLWVADQTGQAHSIDSVRGEGFMGVTWVGDRIVTSNVREMIVHDADGRNPVTLRGYSNIYLQVTPCGPARVAYAAHEVNRRIHIASTDINTGSEAAITSGPRDQEPVCTPDGSTLVFVRWADQGTRRELMRRTLSSGEETVLHELGRSGNLPAFPAVTPDGKNVLWLEVDGTNPYEWLRMMPIAGGDAVKIRLSALSEAGSNLFVKSYALAPDGRSILFLQHDRDGVGNIWSVTLDGKPARKISDFRSDLVFAFDVSPDGRLVIVRGSRVSDVVLIKNVR